ARYFFLRRGTDQPLDFDIGLAKEQSSENPVFYVQYAHARICSILRKAAGVASDAEIDVEDALRRLVPVGVDLSPLMTEPELTLIRKIAEFPEIVEIAAEQLSPHKLPHYVEDLAATFHQFYTVCRVVTEDTQLTVARLALADATRLTLARALALVGVSAPERM
ncbi:MAG TPA: DALR anticodon-binding domain-containing protein, partial [Gaiellaceae bacterium]